MDGFLPCSPRHHIPIRTEPPQSNQPATAQDLIQEAMRIGRQTGLQLALEHVRDAANTEEAAARIEEARDLLERGPSRAEAQANRRIKGGQAT